MYRSPSPRDKVRFLGSAAALCLGGCVHAYQPLYGLQRPVVIDTSVANFTDVHLDIYCPPTGGLNRSEAAALCRKVSVLFENQGAEVRTATRDRRFEAEGAGWDQETPAAATPRGTSLVMELRAQDVKENNDPLSWALCSVTFTLVPGVTEYTFTQEVVILDDTGFLLVSDQLRGRVVQRFGIGAWGGNKVLDLVARDPDEELTGDVASRALSQDLYQQLSQLVFNAAMRTSVLGEGAASEAAPQDFGASKTGSAPATAPAPTPTPAPP